MLGVLDGAGIAVSDGEAGPAVTDPAGNVVELVVA